MHQQQRAPASNRGSKGATPCDAVRLKHVNSSPRLWTSAVLVSALVFSVFGIGAPATAAPGDWPQFRGPERTGVGNDVDLADSWPADGPPVKWQVDFLGEGYGSVAVRGDLVFVQGTQRNQSVVFALDRRSGEQRWVRALGPSRDQDQGNGPRSTPTVTADGIFVLTEHGELAKLDAESGAVLWQFNMLERYNSRNLRWSISESPLVDDQNVYVMPGGDGGSIVAVDRKNGETVWRSTELEDDASYSSLVFTEIDGVRAIAGFTQQAGVGVRASDGKLLWRYEAPANRTANAAAPVAGDGLVFYSSSYGTGGGAVRPDGRGGSQEAWFKSNLQNHHGGVVLHEGHLYGFFGPALGCVELGTGEVVWRARSVGKGSLAIADDKLFLLSERRRVGLAKATPEGYEELGRFEIADRDWPTWAYPVVSGGTLYLRNQNALTAYDVSAEGVAAASR